MKRSLGPDTLVFPAPVFIVGSYNSQKHPNLMAVAWGGICSSVPPSIGISIREATYTYENIICSKAFTVNIPSISQVKKADYMGIYSGRNINKFTSTGLTPIESDFVNAPYVEEFLVNLECRLIHMFDLGLHKQFVGEILNVRADESVLDESEKIDITKLEPIIFAPGKSAYYSTGTFLGQAFSIGRNI